MSAVSVQKTRVHQYSHFSNKTSKRQVMYLLDALFIKTLSALEASTLPIAVTVI